MTPEVVNLIQACAWAPSQFLIISANVYANLIYYSHLGSVIPALLIAFFIFINGRKDLANILLMITAIFFSLWVFSDLVLWATEYPSYTMFFWALEIISEPLVYFFAFYFFYAYVFKKDFSFFKKILFFVPLLPTFFFASTRLGLLGYDISNCDRAAVEGVLATYGYAIEILYTLLIVGFAVFAWRKAQETGARKQIILFSIGIVLFLLSFSIGNIIEVFSLDWGVGQYGLFGAPIFVAFLAYLIVKYRAFNVRLIGAQALVTGMWLSVLSLLFIRNIDDVRIIVSITLIFVLTAGISMVRGVYREIKQREDLADTASLITHQIRGVFTNTKSGLSNLLEGTYGPVPPSFMSVMEAMFKSQVDGVKEVETFLQAQKIESGTIQYEKKSFDLKAVVEEKFAQEKPRTDTKRLQYELQIDTGDYMFNGDQVYLTQVIANLIDNAIRYTEKGSITVQLSKKADSVLYSVKDSGIGIPDEDKEKMFTKYGHGKDSRKINADTAGLGLYIVKGIVAGHRGKIWYETEVGKGTTFFVELPISQTSK